MAYVLKVLRPHYSAERTDYCCLNVLVRTGMHACFFIMLTNKVPANILFKNLSCQNYLKIFLVECITVIELLKALAVYSDDL